MILSDCRAKNMLILPNYARVRMCVCICIYFNMGNTVVK